MIDEEKRLENRRKQKVEKDQKSPKLKKLKSTKNPLKIPEKQKPQLPPLAVIDPLEAES